LASENSLQRTLGSVPFPTFFESFVEQVLDILRAAVIINFGYRVQLENFRLSLDLFSVPWLLALELRLPSEVEEKLSFVHAFHVKDPNVLNRFVYFAIDQLT